MIEVRAIAKGFAPLDPTVNGMDSKGRPLNHPKAVAIEPGTVFRIASEKQFSKEWMERLTPVEVAPVQSAEPVLQGAPAIDSEGRPARKSRK